MPKVYSAGDQLSAADLNAIVKVAGLYAADAGGTDAYAITVSPAPASYVAGDIFTFKANTANTGAATLNVNSLGAKTIKKSQGIDLADNDIKASQLVVVQYDGTNFQMLSPLSQGQYAVGLASDLSTSAAANNDETITIGFRPKIIELTYWIQGHGSATGSADYQNESGIAIFDGTTLKFIQNMMTWVKAPGADDTEGFLGGDSAGTILQSPRTTGLSVGVATGSTAIQITISINAISDTGFTIRKLTASAAGGPARAKIAYRVWG